MAGWLLETNITHASMQCAKYRLVVGTMMTPAKLYAIVKYIFMCREYQTLHVKVCKCDAHI